MLASATVLSIATYGAAIYARDKANINRVQIRLNKTMRMITASRMKTHVADMMRELDWLKFQLMVAYEKIMLLNRIVANSAAPFCMMLVSEAPHQTRYAVRERELRIAWRPRLARRGHSSFLMTSVTLYNQVKLIGKIMKPKTMSKFVKNQLKTWRSI